MPAIPRFGQLADAHADALAARPAVAVQERLGRVVCAPPEGLGRESGAYWGGCTSAE